MKDQYGRTIDYLRVSVTDRCNLRCRYCMPEGCQWLPVSERLTLEEIRQVCYIGAELGIRKVKLTGGEPLVREGCVELVGRLKEIPGIEQVTMTTNGVLLSHCAQRLQEAGLDGVNVSLDTLERETYAAITGADRLADTLAGIMAAKQAGLAVKLNTVLQVGVNDEEWPELLEFAFREGLVLRFIEMMPIGHGARFQTVSNQALLREIQRRFGTLAPERGVLGNGPAVYYRVPERSGTVGLISAINGKFCSQCNRIRLTSTGFLKGCLCYDAGADLRQPLRGGALEQVRLLMRETMEHKPESHCFERRDRVTEHREMSKIGG